MNTAHELMISTQHTDLDDCPWVSMVDGIETRLIQARTDDNIIVMQTRARPGATSTLHRHLGPVFGLTKSGAWGHYPDKFPFLPNSFISEPFNELHRFHNGPEISEIFFVTMGDVEIMDDTGREVIWRSNATTTLAHYLQQCEALGLSRPNVLR